MKEKERLKLISRLYPKKKLTEKEIKKLSQAMTAQVMLNMERKRS